MVRDRTIVEGPELKPHGRLAWSLHVMGTGTYVDLSVMGPECLEETR